MSDQKNAVALASARPVSVFSSIDAFESGQRICGALTSSGLVPTSYQGKDNLGNAMIALDLSNRMSIPVVMVMQNLHVIEGRPSWSSNFIIAALNACGLFSPIRFKVRDLGERDATYTKWVGPKGARQQETVKQKVQDKEWIAYAVEKATGEVLEGPPVTLSMAIAEGWYNRPGSKWLTMPDLMGRYRSAAFFGRLYAPHLLNGMSTADEAVDAAYETQIADVVDITPPSDEKPAARPRGVHAAMNAAKAKEEAPAPEAAKPKRAAKAASEKPPVEEVEDAEILGDEDGGSDDVFGAPGDDDDYSPE